MVKVKNPIKFGVGDYESETQESFYLIESSKRRLRRLLTKSKPSFENIIDIFILPHLVLEVGINSFFRRLVSPARRQEIVSEEEMFENIDKINFIDKLVMYISYSNFNFSNFSKANTYYSIIGKLRKFSETRNRSLHGHSIRTRYFNRMNLDSKLRRKLTLENLKEQIKDFKFIMEGICFYLDCSETYIGSIGKKILLKNVFLDTSFIPKKFYEPKSDKKDA